MYNIKCRTHSLQKDFFRFFRFFRIFQIFSDFSDRINRLTKSGWLNPDLEFGIWNLNLNFLNLVISDSLQSSILNPQSSFLWQYHFFVLLADTARYQFGLKSHLASPMTWGRGKPSRLQASRVRFFGPRFGGFLTQASNLYQSAECTVE